MGKELIYFKILSCNALLAGCHFLGSAGNDKVAAFIASVRTKVYDVVGTFYYFHIMRYDDDGMSSVYQGVKRFQELLDVVEMKSCGGLIKDK